MVKKFDTFERAADGRMVTVYDVVNGIVKFGWCDKWRQFGELTVEAFLGTHTLILAYVERPVVEPRGCYSAALCND